MTAVVCRKQFASRDTLQMVALIGTEVNMALPTTALFDYPSPEALAYFVASAQVHKTGYSRTSTAHNFTFKLPTACVAASQQVLFAWHTVCHLPLVCALPIR